MFRKRVDKDIPLLVTETRANQIKIDRTLKKTVRIKLSIPTIIDKFIAIAQQENLPINYALAHGSCMDYGYDLQIMNYLRDPSIKNKVDEYVPGDFNISMQTDNQDILNSKRETVLALHDKLKVPESLSVVRDFDYHFKFVSRKEIMADPDYFLNNSILIYGNIKTSIKRLEQYLELQWKPFYQTAKTSHIDIKPFIKDLTQEIPESAKYFK